MTDTEPETVAADDPRQILAEELMLLTMLKDAVTAEIEARRDVVKATWTGGSKIAVVLPNVDNPARPIAVGNVRADGGQGVAKIADRDVWTEWCRQNVPHNVVTQAEGRTAWALDVDSRIALEAAYDAAATAPGGFSVDVPAVMLSALEDAGYTLTKVQTVPAATVIMPAWESETLKLTQEAGTPVTPGGLIPEGVAFVEGADPVKPVTTVGKDEAIRRRFVAENRHRLPAITGGVIPELEEN